MIETLWENKENKSKITKNYDGDIIFEMEDPIDHFKVISFNVGYLPPEKYNWFCRVVGNEFMTSIKGAASFSKKELQYQFKGLLGIDL